jgi:NTE family protein
MNQHTVSLVLGAGGARGFAHIGVIQSLEANGFDIRSIAGTSMGALIGGFYAAGRLDVYTRWVTALERVDVIRLLDFAFDRKGLFKGERIINLLKDLIGDRDIENLPVSFTAVATDLRNQKEIWLNRGPLFDAIRASIAIPTIFTPCNYQGMQLVDGALVNPLPIAPTLHDKTDFTVAVNLNGPLEAKPEKSEEEAGDYEDPRQNNYHRRLSAFIEGLYLKRERHDPADVNFLDIAAQSMDTMQNIISRFRLAAHAPDVLVEIPGNACAFHEFHRARELIEIGRRSTDEALARFNKQLPVCVSPGSAQ